MGRQEDLEKFSQLIGKLKNQIFREYHGQSLSNKTMNTIILRSTFLSLLYHNGVLPNSLVENISVENKMEEYDKYFQKHQLLLWSENDQINFDLGELSLNLIEQISTSLSEFTSIHSMKTLLGVLYESLHGDDYRKRKGVFFTPPYLARKICELSFETINSNGNFKSDSLSLESLSRILELKILDNACGGGVFLITMVEYILSILNHYLNEVPESYELLEEKGIVPSDPFSKINYIISNMMYGVDTDSGAIAITEAQLWLLQAEYCRELEDWSWQNRNLHVCDTLIDTILPSKSFDIIIGNPPYMRLSKLNPKYQKILREEYEAIREYNLHALFVVKSLDLLNKGGILGYLLHKNILTLDTYRALRREIITTHSCMYLVDCGQGLFKGVTAETAIMIVKQGIENSKQPVRLALFDANGMTIKEQLRIHQNEYANIISQWNYRFVINLTKQGKILLTHMSDLPLLGDCVSTSRGIETGSNRDFISNIPKQRGNWTPLLRGRDISAYNGHQQSFIDYNRKLLTKPGREDLLQIPKVVLQQNASHPIAYFDDGHYLVLNSVTYLADASSKLLQSLCIFLNSHLISWFFRTVVTNNASLTVNILPNNLSIIPIPTTFDQAIFSNLCNTLQKWKRCKDKSIKPERQFNLWYNLIAEAVVSEAYLPNVFKSQRIHNILRELLLSGEMTEISIDSIQCENLLSIAKEILSHEILIPVRNIH